MSEVSYTQLDRDVKAVMAANTTTGLETQSAIALNEQQSEAVEAVLEFIQDPNPVQWYFTLTGQAGTGKTFCLREIAARAKRSKSRMVFTAPTNKAAKVLRKVVGEAQTIYSLLGLRIDKSGELKQLITGKQPDLTDLDVILIDEGYMTNSTLFGILQHSCEGNGIKVVFIGDAFQLPPVGEPYSPIEKSALGSKLTKVMRHDNQILTLATAIRLTMNTLTPTINLHSDNDANGGVWKLIKRDFKQKIYDAAANGEFGDTDSSKVLAWRNVTVDGYNELIRAAIFGAEAEAGYYLPGDRLVAAAPCERGDEVLLTTDDEAIVEAVASCKHPMELKYKAQELRCRTEQNQIVRLLVIHPESKLLFQNDSQKIAHDARGNPKLWRNFWAHQDLFHQVKYGYALTVHRSQGSTYRQVYVDYQDILYNRNRKEAFQCLYTAVTRPSERLFLA